MSDTPRTDAESCWLFEGLSEVVTADFARGLERELAEAKRDAERYRWLRSNSLTLWVAKAADDKYWYSVLGDELDAELDAEMKEERK